MLLITIHSNGISSYDDFLSHQILGLIFLARFQHLRDRGGSQRSFPHPANSHDGPLGQESLHPHPAKAARHAKAVLRPRQTQVRNKTLGKDLAPISAQQVPLNQAPILRMVVKPDIQACD